MMDVHGEYMHSREMEVELEMFHCDRAHLFVVRSSSLASQYHATLLQSKYMG